MKFYVIYIMVFQFFSNYFYVLCTNKIEKDFKIKMLDKTKSYFHRKKNNHRHETDLTLGRPNYIL